MSKVSVAGEEIYESAGASASSSGSTGSSAAGLISSAFGKKNTSNTDLAGAESANKAADGLDLEPINAERGFEYFRGKVYLDSKQMQIYSVADAIEKRVEAPKQRFARLQQELTQFADDLAKMTEAQGNSEASLWHVLQEEANRLLHTANDLAPAVNVSTSIDHAC
jgi:hypothetical protein